MNQSNNNVDDTSDDIGAGETCPLCVEEMDLSDKNFLPCPCGYRVCMWCWHHIRENLNGLCPACRTPYAEDPHAFSAVNADEIKAKNKERKMKEKQDKLNTPGVKTTVRGGSSQVVDRRMLHNYRVVQRNLVYVIGIPSNACSEETLKRSEYFGQYGKIMKIVIHKNHNSNHAATISAYATFAHKEDARAAIQALEGFWVDGHLLRASFGTTKYCNNFIRGVPCNNPDCVYLHELGDDDDRFTKEEIQQQAVHSKAPSAPGRDQMMITGSGGPSGTGKRPAGETVFPQPVFVQDIPGARNPSRSSSSNGTNSAQSNDGGSQAPPDLDDMPSLPSQPKNPPANQTVRDMRSVVAGATAAPGSFQGMKPASIYNATGGAESKTPTTYNGNAQVPPSGRVNAINPPIVSAVADQKKDPNQQTNSFNGIGKCAVFPVPISSLNISVWSTIRDVSAADLTTNPFDVVKLPISELLELTLPPVDASGISPWPKPVGHYTQFVDSQVSRQSSGDNSNVPTQQLQQQQPMSRPQQQQQPQSNNATAGLQQMLGIKVQGGVQQK